MKNSLQYLFLFSIVLFILPTSKSQKMSIFFDFNDYKLTQSAVETLGKYLGLLQKNNKEVIKIDILGYCDSVGSIDYNQKLSLQRAEVVKKYLIDKQYNVTSINIKGTGKENPAFPNDSEDNRAKNRRVDVIFTTKKQDLPDKTKERSVKLEDTKSITENVQTAHVGENIRLKNINFVPGQATLLKSAMPTVEELIQIMKDNPTLEIQIEGHICCAKDQYNIQTKKDNLLSTQRAETVYNILINNEIEQKRMSYIGYGHTRPLTAERNEEERIRNRRVEIKIIKQ
jgi:outer membrane protein OmpA-like peptidoglycan-associated protein